ncbi:MAG: DUF2336 domain-containing protein [Pseudomonadota bacterium]
MGSFKDELKTWTTAAASNTDEARSALSAKLSAFVLDADKPMAADESAVVDELLSRVISHAERAVRAQLAGKLSTDPAAPKKLLKTLACDDIDIAEPILRKSAALAETDLIDIVRGGQGDHRSLVAGRPDVSAGVSEALVSFGEENVMLRLVSNNQAEIAEETMGDIVAYSEDMEALRRPLLSREDMPSCLAHKMFWWVSSALRVHILENYPVDADVLDAALKEATRDAIADDAARGGLTAEATSILRAAPAMKINDFISAIDRGDMRRAGIGLMQLLDVDAALAKRILTDASGEALAIAARAMGADLAQFTRLYLMLDYKRYGKPRPMGHMERAAKVFKEIDYQRAAQTVQYWNIQNDQRRAA